MRSILLKPALSILVIMMLPSMLLQSYGQDSTFALGDGRQCPFEVEHIMLTMPSLTNLSVTVLGASTDSYNDFYLIVYREGLEEHRFYFFQNRIPDIGENWIFGPLNFNDKIDFQIYSRYLDQRTRYEPNRPGKIRELGPDQWEIRFEDWCDNDWNDLVVEVKLEAPEATINILRPAHLTSFVTDDARTFRVEAEGRALDEEGNDLSDRIFWFVYPGRYSGSCYPKYKFDSRRFNFTCIIPPRSVRESNPISYSIVATVLIPPYWLAIWDINRMIQDFIDVVRQQYIDYGIKLPFKSEFSNSEPVEIPEKYRVDSYSIFYDTRAAYREWADNPAAYFVASSGYRNPVHNEDVGGIPTSMHQYHWAIDMDFADEGEEGTKDDLDFLRRFLRGYLREPFDQFYQEHSGYVHIEMFNYSEDFPGIER